MSVPDFIAVDWGTTSFRAYLVRDRLILDEVSGPHGILTIEAGGHAEVLRQMTERWRKGGPIRTVLSGMIGSRQGWREVPYAPCPASVGELARRLSRWTEPGLGEIFSIPGVLQEDGLIPDVMRGEETQVFGALALMGLSEAVCILPGTHSKRLEVRGGEIVSFQTFMTGEVFAALRSHTILGRLMKEGQVKGDGFLRGIEVARSLDGPGALLHAIFGARTLGLTDRLPQVELADYLSGLLIGCELRQAFPAGQGAGIVIGSSDLETRYVRAARLLGLKLTPAPEDCVVAGQAAILASMEEQAA